jgi:inosine/xanthosine triphosphate pyrophosphatase family protein
MALPLLIATTNPAKAARLRDLCDLPGVELLDPVEVGAQPVIDETSASHLANAVRKAVGWSRLHEAATVASDGGLSIPGLGYGWESLLTGRATGGNVSDEEHATRLLRRMRDLSGSLREAHWTEAIAIARNGEVIGAWEANGLAGLIAESYVPPSSGANGFWVTGLWQTDDGRRYWELDEGQLAASGDPWARLAVPVRELLARLVS